ncbi:hypothetical protein N7488_009932 [Penicillium malachiteum]|nr:hypothetical protein N7488_009932 [Penicillium malachiteum]
MLEKSISALSCIYLGKIKGDDSILRYGVGLYNEGIRILANKLRRGILDDDVLYTTVIFQVLESWYADSEKPQMNAVTSSKGYMNSWQSLVLAPVSRPLDELFEMHVIINELFTKLEDIRSIGGQENDADLSACYSLKQRILEWYIEKESTIGHPPTQ